MNFRRKAIQDTGVYQHHDLSGQPLPEFSARVWVGQSPHRVRTFRKLAAKTAKAAIKEAATGDWQPKADLFDGLIDQWLEAGCPGRKVAPKDLRQVNLSLPWLRKYFGKFKKDEIRPKHLPGYSAWRRKAIRRGTGRRTVMLDWGVLSNIHHYGVEIGELDFNYIYRARERVQVKIRHASAVMPHNAEEIHQVAGYFLTSWRSEVMGWLSFFSEFTGNRHSELLRLDLNAGRNQSGHLEWFTTEQIKERSDGFVGKLHIERSKHGINPWIGIGPEFAEMIAAFRNWHKTRFGIGRPGQPHWYFPGEYGKLLAANSFNHALNRATQVLGLPKINPHGFRAFYATKRARDGDRTIDIAYAMGDRSVAMVERTYILDPTGAKLWWVPADGVPAWQSWLPEKPARSGHILDTFGLSEKDHQRKSL